jgi:hypothetical protein
VAKELAMGNRVLLRWVGVALVLAGVAATEEPKPLTAEQKENLKQRDQHLAESRKFYRVRPRNDVSTLTRGVETAYAAMARGKP